MSDVSNWFANLNGWQWVWLVVAVLVVIFILRNLPDLFRYLRIRAM